MKTDIKPIVSAVNKLCSLSPIFYELKNYEFQTLSNSMKESDFSSSFINNETLQITVLPSSLDNPERLIFELAFLAGTLNYEFSKLATQFTEVDQRYIQLALQEHVMSDLSNVDYDFSFPENLLRVQHLIGDSIEATINNIVSSEPFKDIINSEKQLN